MERTQYILSGFTKAIIAGEFPVELPVGAVLQIDFFPNNDLTIETIEANPRRFTFNEPAGKYERSLPPLPTETLTDLQIKYEDEDILYAGDVLICKKSKKYILIH